MTETWTTWSRSVTTHPRRIVHPVSTAEVVKLVEVARAQGLPVKAYGAGHSFTPIAATDGFLLRLDRMNHVLAHDDASGPAQKSRLPRPTWPEGLSLLGTEGAGEVQTPVKGAAARDLRLGDRVLMRHAKAGELCERFDTVTIVSADGGVETVPTYRGEGKNFG